MDKVIRDTQLKLLETFSETSKTFALSGGTALELFYLKHRFSRDLDFFSAKYNVKEIDTLISKFNEVVIGKIKLENELVTPYKARVRFYTVKIRGTTLPLKIDFIEDVFFDKPKIKKFDEIPVYDANDIYFQKIVALLGTYLVRNDTGREIITGRKEVRDVVDIYYLSKKVCPLRRFIKNLTREYQRGLVHWYRSYPRQEVKLGVLDLDIYDKNFDVLEMITYLDNELKKFIGEVTG